MERKDRELLEKVQAYDQRSAELVLNAGRLIKKGEFEKAGEFLWGSVANYINALTMIATGKSTRDHRELVQKGKEIAVANRDKRLFDAIDTVGQQLHANYYHGFLSQDAFRDFYPEILYAIEQLKRILQSELSRPLRQKS